MKQFILVILILIANILELHSQGSAGDGATFESRYIVDMPTAGVIPKSSFSLYGLAYSNGGIMCEIFASPFTNFLIGISFGGTGIIGESDVVFQELPSVHIRFRVLDESLNFPAILIGVNTQGRGVYSKSNEHFEIYSPGVFLALSKNYNWFLGNIAFHFGGNYSFEAKPETRDPNFYCGLEQSVGASVSLNLELNAAINEYNEDMIDKIGILNTSLRWSINSEMTLEFQLRDIFSNRKDYSSSSRYIGLEYVSTF